MKDSHIISHHPRNTKAGLVSGLIAGLVSSIVLMILSTVVAIPDFNFVLIQGSVFGLADSALTAWVVYFVISLAWGYLYSFIEPKMESDSPVKKGLFAGFIIWAFFMIVLMPIAGAGFFLKEYGLSAAITVLIVDLVFGDVLGYAYDKLNS